MPARLVPLTPGAAPIVTLRRPVLLVGRHAECDVRLDRPSVSRRHCCLALAYDRLTIRDLGSRHGVWVNGRKIDESRLKPGDEIAIGPVLFRLEDDEPPPPRPTPPRPAAEAPPSLPDLPADTGEDLLPLSENFRF